MKDIDIVVTCNYCEKQGESHAYTIIDGDKSPTLKDMAINGMLFEYKCDNCEKVTIIDFPVKYVQDNGNFTVEYTTDSQEFDNSLDTYTEEFEESEGGFEKVRRIVSSQEELSEKIIIYNAGLDDKVIEILKLMYEVFYKETHPDKIIKDVYFSTLSGKNSFLFFLEDEQSVSKKIDPELYDAYAKKLEKLELSQDFVIDRNWAYNALQNIMVIDSVENAN